MLFRSEPFIDNSLYTLVGRIVGGPREFNKDLGFNKTVNNLGDTKLILKASFKETEQLMEDKTTDRIVKVKHPKYSIKTNGDTLYHYTQLRYTKVQTDYQVEITPDSITGEFFADLIPENFYTTSVIAGLDDEGKTYRLSEDYHFPVNLAEKRGNNEYLTTETGDSISYINESTLKRDTVAVLDSIPFSEIGRASCRERVYVLV